MSGDTGETLAVMDGAALTAWRTACASALAARYLAREDASHLVMVGAGALAPHLIRAHRAVRPITRVTLWNRTRSHAISTAFALSAAGIEPTIADDLEEAVREADIVSCATLSPTPLVRGAWLKKGAHLDLVGAFSLKTREADDAAVRRARVYVDSRATAPKGSGDIAIPLKKKIIGAARTSRAICSSFAVARRRAASARTRSRCSSPPGSRWRIWPRRCWCGTG